jgi:hypothetical protein
MLTKRRTQLVSCNWLRPDVSRRFSIVIILSISPYNYLFLSSLIEVLLDAAAHSEHDQLIKFDFGPRSVKRSGVY